MWHKKITWKFFISSMAVTVLSVAAVIWYSSRLYDRLHYETVIDDVATRAVLLKPSIMSLVAANSPLSVDSLCKAVGNRIKTRITIVTRDGRVIGDSERDPSSMENHANRPEILEALGGGIGVQQRFSATLKEQMLYYAIPIDTGGVKAAAALRLAVPIHNIHKQESLFFIRSIVAALLIILVLAILSYYLSRSLGTPVSHLTAGARRFASGDLSFKLSIPQGVELSGLAEAMNTMAQSLDERIKTVTGQRNELNAILTGMSEGVIAVNADRHIISINTAASKLLSVSPEAASGRWLPEVVRNSELQNFLERTFSENVMIEHSFTLVMKEGEKHIQGHGTVLKGVKGEVTGAVLVLNDVTRMHHLENLRKEFVANVSHELRTPLTSIKGFVETIQHGNYDLSDEVKNFLSIISSRTDRLCSIVDDILTLSSIEREFEHREILYDVYPLLPVLEDAVRSCEGKASVKKIRIALKCDPSVKAKMNTQLIEQAIVNLIDNAIKYSDEGKDVELSAGSAGSGIEIRVADQGIGIEPQYHERIFERFYRVDKARSRKLGGTGLGLSIVKNIAIAHGGRVSVQSVPGKGSTFIIYLPGQDGA